MNKNLKLNTKHAVKKHTKPDQPNLKDLLLDLQATGTHLIIPSREIHRHRKVTLL
jgi:hypothetical protein